MRHDDTRVYEQIWDDEDVNAWLICWSEDSDTGFHDHDDSGRRDHRGLGQRTRGQAHPGWGGRGSRELGAGTTFTVPPTAIHRVLHAGEGPAVTIHAYSPPLRRMGAYRVGAHGELERESQPFEHELGAELALA